MKQQEWDERCKPHAQEIEAISDTIKILNSDDALELFKVIAQELEVNQKKCVIEELIYDSKDLDATNVAGVRDAVEVRGGRSSEVREDHSGEQVEDNHGPEDRSDHRLLGHEGAEEAG